MVKRDDMMSDGHGEPMTIAEKERQKQMKEIRKKNMQKARKSLLFDFMKPHLKHNKKHLILFVLFVLFAFYGLCSSSMDIFFFILKLF